MKNKTRTLIDASKARPGGYIDLHTHTLFSDGELVPSELVYRAQIHGYAAIGITDHGDFSTLAFIIPRMRAAARSLAGHYGITVIPGIEVTYVPPVLIARAIRESRALGAQMVIVHGETPAETVPPGTNRAGILAGADVIAHPGFITDEDASLAASHGVCLEITTRPGHNRTNAHVAKTAARAGARLVFDTDTHAPDDLMNSRLINTTLKAAGLRSADFVLMQKNAAELIKNNHSRRARSCLK